MQRDARKTEQRRKVKYRSAGVYKEDVFPVSEILEGGLLPPLHDVLLRPAVVGNELLELRLILPVPAYIDVSHQGAAHHVHHGQDDDGRLTGDVAGRILGQEDVGADDRADPEGKEGEGVDGNLLGVASHVARVPGVAERETWSGQTLEELSELQHALLA